MLKHQLQTGKSQFVNKVSKHKIELYLIKKRKQGTHKMPKGK